MIYSEFRASRRDLLRRIDLAKRIVDRCTDDRYTQLTSNGLQLVQAHLDTLYATLEQLCIDWERESRLPKGTR